MSVTTVEVPKMLQLEQLNKGSPFVLEPYITDKAQDVGGCVYIPLALASTCLKTLVLFFACSIEHTERTMVDSPVMDIVQSIVETSFLPYRYRHLL